MLGGRRRARRADRGEEASATAGVAMGGDGIGLLYVLMYYDDNTVMPMYALNTSSGTPIYRQLIDQTAQLVASGRLPAGERLPSVRAVAAELGINPMTVSKAYSLLERGGIVTRQRGMGMVVAEAKVSAAEAIRPQADAMVEVARRLRLTREDVAEAVELAWNVHMNEEEL